VAKGLEAGERVVTTGFARLTDNAKIAISSGDGTAAPGANRPRQGSRAPGEKSERKRDSQPGTPGTTPSAPPAAPK
jgi:multidrug efflux system membrane fusion protein